MTRLLHRGHVEAAALLITEDDALARKRAVLRALGPSDRVTTVERIDGEPSEAHLLIQYAQPRRVDVTQLAGAALTKDAELLTAFPLSNALRKEAIGAHAQLVFATRGAPCFARVGERVEPARWLDPSGFRLLSVRSLGAPPAPIEAALPTRTVRAVLGQAELTEEALAVARAMVGVSARPPAGSAMLDTLVRAMAVAIRLGQALFGSSTSSSDARSAGTSRADGAKALPADTAPREPPWIVRKLASWMNALRARAWRSALGDYLAKKHAEYLARLIEQLDQGDLDAALRHAIPLSTEGSGTPQAPQLGLPTPRTQLTISKSRGVGGGLGLEGSLFAMLKDRYRKLYEKLLALGRIDDAAFVLAELLNDIVGAVALLEKGGRLREAAELAEARKLEPALVVRQWIIARDIPRAILLARRHGAFEAAITHLRNEPEARRTLTLAWADVRASAGDFLGALLALELGQALPPPPRETPREPKPTGEVRVACQGVTKQGLLRSRNEDRFFLSKRALPVSLPFASGLLCGVIDGQGAMVGGLPAEVAVRHFEASDQPTADLDDLARLLLESAARASAAMSSGAGAVCTVASIAEGSLLVLQVGDSRGYLLRGTRLVHFTPDHSLWREQVKSGALKESDVASYPLRNVVTRALGSGQSGPPDAVRLELRRHDRLLLCTDGLWRDVPDETLHAALQKDAGEALGILLTHAEEAGAKDDLAIVIADFAGEGLPLADGDSPIVAHPYRAEGAGDSTILPLAQRWSELAHEGGGAEGAAALVWRARLSASIDPETERRARVLLHSATPESLAARIAFISALAQRSEPFLAPLARLALRSGTRDHALFGQPSTTVLEKLENLGGGGVLREDRPKLEAPKPSTSGEPRLLSMGARGALAIRDAVLLPNGNWLVALGEAGTRILKPDGSTLVAFEAPSSSLVLSDTGARALALMRRGELTLVHRIDILPRRIGDAFELSRLSSFASTFDGERWSVVLGAEGHLLDVLGEVPRSLFRLEHCAHVERALGCVSFEVVSASSIERFRYDEHNMVLRVRQALPERFDRELIARTHAWTVEPIIAHLRVEPEGSQLTFGAAPHPTPTLLRGCIAQKPQLTAGKAHVAFRASQGAPLGTLGRYTLLRLVRDDGLTTTHLAKLTGTPSENTSLVEVSSTPQEVDGDEVQGLQLLARVNHPNVVSTFEFGRHEGRQYLATEHVRGIDLRSLWRLLHARHMPLPVPIAVAVVLQLCDALEALHGATETNRAIEKGTNSLRFVHGQLSPERVTVGFDGSVKLGVASVAMPDLRVRNRSRIGYLSPEQVRGVAVDARSDIFVLGTLFYELLTGRRLFRGEGDFQTVQLTLAAVVPPMSTAEVTISTALEALVRKALAKEPGDRWQSARELREALLPHVGDAAPSNEHALKEWMRLHFAHEIRAEEDTTRALSKPGGESVVVVNLEGDVQAHIACAASTKHRVVFHGAHAEHLVCWDEEGRLLALELQRGTIATAALR